MTDIYDLAEELDEVNLADKTTADTVVTATKWSPGQNGGFATFAPVTAPESSTRRPKRSPRADKPAKTVKTAKKTKGAPRGKNVTAPSSELALVKMLPEPKPPKKISRAQQKKLDKAHQAKERAADAAAMRINGVDGDVEIPKKPWLTVFSGKRARPDEVAETLTDLASMLENGQSERMSVEALAVQYANYDIGQAYERVVMLLDRGVTLGEAMADQEDALPPVVRELIAAAKMPRDTHRNLRQAAIIIVEADNIRSQLKSALFKPGLMFFFLLIFVLCSVQWLLPMTASMFTGIGAAVPPLTTTILTIGESLKWVLLGFILLIVLLRFFWAVYGKRNERIATYADTKMLDLALVGEIVKMAMAARFSDVLAACLAVGMSEIEALETAGRACGNRALARWVSEHVGRQRIGMVAFSDVAKTEMLPWNFRNRIETTNSITRRVEILRELAESFHQKSKQRLERFAERVGPITEGIVVGVVLVVVLLIITPLMSFIPTLLDTIG